MTLRLLIFGSTGMVATELRQLAGEGLAVTALGRDDADLANPEACAARVAEAEADVVINAAAWTDVDKAEEEEVLATRINAQAPGAMAAASAARGIPFLRISTDYVFDGGGDRPWREDDPVAPLGAYGRSKLAGERAVLAAGGHTVILRTAWVHAAHGQNFLRNMLRVGAERTRLAVVDDQRGGPTAAADIAVALVTIARAWQAGRGVPGVFNFCGRPATTWCGFARAIFARAGWARTPEIEPIRTEDWPTPAARPANSVLECAKIRAAYGIEQPDWRVSLETILAEIREQAA
jgi:dTDP-4-dehydrorhamnose reductase